MSSASVPFEFIYNNRGTLAITRDLSRMIDRLSRTNTELGRLARGARYAVSGFASLNNAIKINVGFCKSLSSLVAATGANFFKFQTTSLKTAGSMQKLNTAYLNMIRNTKSINVSLMQTANLFAKLQSRSMPTRMFMSTRQTMKAISELHSAMARFATEEDIGEQLGSLFDSINPDRLGEAFDILNRLNPRNVNSISQAVERLSAISTDAGQVATTFGNRLIGSITQADPATKAYLKIVESLNKLKGAWENVLTGAAEGVGDRITAILDKATAMIPKLQGPVMALVEGFMNALPALLNFGTGVLKIITSLAEGFGSLSAGTQQAIIYTVVFSRVLGPSILSLVQMGAGLFNIAAGLRAAGIAIPMVTAGVRVLGFTIGTVFPWIGAIAAALTAINYIPKLWGGKTLVTQIGEWIGGEGEKAEVPTLPTFNMPEIALPKTEQKPEQPLSDIEKEIMDVNSGVSKAVGSFEGLADVVKNLGEEKVLAAMIQHLKNVNALLGVGSSRLKALGAMMKIMGPAPALMATNAAVATREWLGAMSRLPELYIDLQAAISAGATERVKELSDEIAQAQSNLENFGQAVGQGFEKLNEQLDLERGLFEESLRIARSLYGTPGLAVEAQLKVVDAMQRQLESKKAELSQWDALIAKAKEAGAAEEDLWSARMRQKELLKDIQSLTAEQLEAVKELRDGYLDAVKAEAFSFGRFSKIIITQQNGIMHALRTGMAKQNYLLGQAGVWSPAMPYRFSGGNIFNPRGGMGSMLETLEGRPLTDKDLQTRLGAIPNATARQMASLVLKMTNSQDVNIDTMQELIGATKDLSNTFRGTAGMAALAPGTPAANAIYEAMRKANMETKVGAVPTVASGGGGVAVPVVNVGGVALGGGPAAGGAVVGATGEPGLAVETTVAGAVAAAAVNESNKEPIYPAGTHIRKTSSEEKALQESRNIQARARRQIEDEMGPFTKEQELSRERDSLRLDLQKFEEEHARSIWLQAFGIDQYSTGNKQKIESMRNRIGQLQEQINAEKQAPGGSALVERRQMFQRQYDEAARKLEEYKQRVGYYNVGQTGAEYNIYGGLDVKTLDELEQTLKRNQLAVESMDKEIAGKLQRPAPTPVAKPAATPAGTAKTSTTISTEAAATATGSNNLASLFANIALNASKIANSADRAKNIVASENGRKHTLPEVNLRYPDVNVV